MIITQNGTNNFEINCTDDEILHFLIIINGLDLDLVRDIPSLFRYILSYLDDHYHKAVLEPEIGLENSND